MEDKTTIIDDKMLEIDDILKKDTTTPKKKKKDGKAKGDRTELHLCKLLTKLFNVDFSRASGSGSRWSQVNNLPSHAKKSLTGDICIPENFLWVIESKGGYEESIDLNNAIDGKIPTIDSFIEQTKRDSEFCGRKPLICWKRNRKPWTAMIRLMDLSPYNEEMFQYRFHYNDWIIVPLEVLISCTKNNFWFEENNARLSK